MDNIHTIADRVKNVTISNCLSMSNGEFLKEEYKDSFNIDAWFFTPGIRRAYKNGNISYVPNHLHLAGVERIHHIHPKIYVGAATMPDKHGYMSLSTSNTYEKQMLEAADIVILEINKNYPRTFGEFLFISNITMSAASNICFL